MEIFTGMDTPAAEADGLEPDNGLPGEGLAHEILMFERLGRRNDWGIGADHLGKLPSKKSRGGQVPGGDARIGVRSDYRHG